MSKEIEELIPAISTLELPVTPEMLKALLNLDVLPSSADVISIASSLKEQSLKYMEKKNKLQELQCRLENYNQRLLTHEYLKEKKIQLQSEIKVLTPSLEQQYKLILENPILTLSKQSNKKLIKEQVEQFYSSCDKAYKAMDIKKAQFDLVLLKDKANTICLKLTKLNILCSFETSLNELEKLQDMATQENETLLIHHSNANSLQEELAQATPLDELTAHVTKLQEQSHELGVQLQDIESQLSESLLKNNDEIAHCLAQYQEEKDKTAFFKSFEETYFDEVFKRVGYLDPARLWDASIAIKEEELALFIKLLKGKYERECQIEKLESERVRFQDEIQRISKTPERESLSTQNLTHKPMKLLNLLAFFGLPAPQFNKKTPLSVYYSLLLETIPLIDVARKKNRSVLKNLNALIELHKEIASFRALNHLLPENDWSLPNIDLVNSESSAFDEEYQTRNLLLHQVEQCRPFLDSMDLLILLTDELKQVNIDYELNFKEMGKSNIINMELEQARIDDLKKYVSTIKNSILESIKILKRSNHSNAQEFQMLLDSSSPENVLEVEGTNNEAPLPSQSPSLGEIDGFVPPTTINLESRGSDFVQELIIEKSPPNEADGAFGSPSYMGFVMKEEEDEQSPNYVNFLETETPPYQPGAGLFTPSPKPPLHTSPMNEYLLLRGSADSFFEIEPASSDSSTFDISNLVLSKATLPLSDSDESVVSINRSPQLQSIHSSPITSKLPSDETSHSDAEIPHPLDGRDNESEYKQEEVIVDPIQLNYEFSESLHRINLSLIGEGSELWAWYNQLHHYLKDSFSKTPNCYKATHLIQDINYLLKNNRIDLIDSYKSKCPIPYRDFNILLRFKPSTPPNIEIEMPEAMMNQYKNLRNDGHLFDAELFFQATQQLLAIKEGIANGTLDKKSSIPTIAADPKYAPLKYHRGPGKAWEAIEDLIRSIIGFFRGEEPSQYANKPCMFFKPRSAIMIQELEDSLVEQRMLYC